MKRTTGDEATARSIALRTSSDKLRAWKGVRKVVRKVVVGAVARVAARKAWSQLDVVSCERGVK